MSTQTEHLGLHQWEPEDNFLRSDFNQDFAKIDAATGALRQWASTACVAGSVLITDKDSAIDVDLGFRPKLVLLGMYGAEYCFFRICADNMEFVCFRRGDSSSVSSSGRESVITDSGFKLARTSWITKADENTTSLCYVAFR